MVEHLLAESKADAGAGVLVAAVDETKDLKQVLLLLLRDSHAGVFDNDFKLAWRVHKLDLNRALPSVLDGVRDEVDQDLQQSVLVSSQACVR